MHSQLKQLHKSGITPQGTTEWSDPVPNPKVLDAITELQAMVCQSDDRKMHSRRKQTSVKKKLLNIKSSVRCLLQSLKRRAGVSLKASM